MGVSELLLREGIDLWARFAFAYGCSTVLGGPCHLRGEDCYNLQCLLRAVAQSQMLDQVGVRCEACVAVGAHCMFQFLQFSPLLSCEQLAERVLRDGVAAVVASSRHTRNRSEPFLLPSGWLLDH